MNTKLANFEPTRDEYLFAWRERHGVVYSAAFVPFSKSRNAKPAPKPNDLSINWRVTLTKGGRAVSTDYQQGIGHLPEAVRVPWKGANINRLVLAHEPIVMAAIETGKIQTENGFPNGALLPPNVDDVLGCLALDAAVLDCGAYEDWASEYGYEPDSRKGEQVFNECRRIALELRAVLGEPAFSELLKMPEET